MAASLVLAGRESGHKDTASRQAVECCIERYASEMRKFAEMSMLEVARYQVHRLQQVEPIEAALQKAERATPLHTLEQLTEPVTTEGKKKNAERRFKEIKPNLMRVRGVQAEEVLASLSAWQQMLAPAQRHLLSFYRPVDVAFKVVGTGSVGLRDYCIYFEGNGPQDPLFLQIKEEPLSGYAACLPDAHPPAHNGQRVAEGQRAMQVVSDPFLGWTHFGGRDYLVRQLNDHKGSIELADLAGDGLTAYAEICGELLARGHARSGDPMILAGYLGAGDGFAEALATFGITYADQTEKDWKTLCAALRQKGKSGEIKS